MATFIMRSDGNLDWEKLILTSSGGHKLISTRTHSCAPPWIYYSRKKKKESHRRTLHWSLILHNPHAVLLKRKFDLWERIWQWRDNFDTSEPNIENSFSVSSKNHIIFILSCGSWWSSFIPPTFFFHTWFQLEIQSTSTTSQGVDAEVWHSQKSRLLFTGLTFFPLAREWFYSETST